MANTTINTNLIPKLWASKIWKEGKKKSFFDKLTAKDGSNVIHVNTDLSKARGDKVNFGLLMRLSGAGVSGNTTLKGAEEAMTTYDFGVTINQYRNAVTMYDFDTQKSAYEMYPLIKEALVDWLGDWKDNKVITVATASPTATEVLYAGDATSEATIDANDILTVALIGKAKRKAMLHSPKVMPLKIDGKELYAMFVHPNAYRDLKTDTAWTNAHYYAHDRGLTNPIFTGSSCIIDDVIIYEYERVSATTTGASSAVVCHNLLMGKQAICEAVAREGFPIKDSDDYENVQGLGIAFWGELAKSLYNEKDFGIINVLTGGAAD
jgi:N4-gp56 family major capsid protein